MINRNKELRTARLVLKPIGEESRNEMFGIFRSDEVKKTYMIPDFSSEEEEEKLFQRFVTLSSSDGKFVYGVYLKDKLIGFLNEVSKDESSIEMGYVIYPAYKNRGYATEAFRAVIEELFRVGFKTVRAGFFIENGASRRVMEKSGLKAVDGEEVIRYRGTDHKCRYMEIRAV